MVCIEKHLHFKEKCRCEAVKYSVSMGMKPSR